MARKANYLTPCIMIIALLRHPDFFLGHRTHVFPCDYTMICSTYVNTISVDDEVDAHPSRRAPESLVQTA